MTVTGPDFVALQVHDLERSARFYTEWLGLRRAPHSPPNAVVFATSPTPLAVREPAVDLDAVDQLCWGVAPWLKADDADALHASLAQAGVAIAQAPFDGPFGRTLSFRDPDGYVITIHDRG
jgi:predicted enzyme related to lactoylglutathione lyase